MEVVLANRIGWRDEFSNARPDEGNEFAVDGRQFWRYLTMCVDAGKLPQDMVKDEIVEGWKGVNAAKVKAISGWYDLGCFKRWPRLKSKKRHRRQVGNHLDGDRRQRPCQVSFNSQMI